MTDSVGLSPSADDTDIHPPYAWADYGSTRLRAPHRPLVALPQNLTEVTGPLLGAEREWSATSPQLPSDSGNFTLAPPSATRV